MRQRNALRQKENCKINQEERRYLSFAVFYFLFVFKINWQVKKRGNPREAIYGTALIYDQLRFADVWRHLKGTWGQRFAWVRAWAPTPSAFWPGSSTLFPPEAIDFGINASSLLFFHAKMVTDRFQTPLLSVRLERFALFLCSLPLLSFMSCVAIALVWHFDETTNTHCNVSINGFSCHWCIANCLPFRLSTFIRA